MLLWIISVISFVAFASENGGFYQCNPEKLKDATNPMCVFEASATAPSSWTTVGPHVVDQSLLTHERGISDIDGAAKVLSAKPWVNGDDSGEISDVAAMGPNEPDDENFGQQWNYVLIFELIAVLRNKLMFDPESLFDKSEWNKYTRVMTDCNVKQVKEVNDECHTGYSMDEVYDFMMDASSASFSHHYLLQFLEEGAIDVVCLVAEPGIDERCDIARMNMGIDTSVDNFDMADHYCDCWMNAYREVYPDQPDPTEIVDVNFQTCQKQEPYLKDECEDSGNSGTTSGGAGTSGPTCCDGSTADMTTTPPTCADGNSPLPPDSTEGCDDGDEPIMTDQPTPEPTEQVVIESEDNEDDGDMCSTSTSPCCCDGSSPDTSSMPPTCADGSNAMQPGTACEAEETDPPTYEPTPEPTDQPTAGMPSDPCEGSTGPCCCDGSTPDMTSKPPSCADGEKPLSPGGVCEVVVTEEPTATPTEEAPPVTGPFCCDGSTPDMNSRPPSCADGSNAKAPTGSCDDGHTMQSKCNAATNNIIVFDGADDVIAYACDGEDAEALNKCSGDTEMCTASQMERVGVDCNGSNAFYDIMCEDDVCQCGGVIEMESDSGVLGTLCCEEVLVIYDSEDVKDETDFGTGGDEDDETETEHSQAKLDKKKAKKKLAKKYVEKLRLMKEGYSKDEAKAMARNSKKQMGDDHKDDASDHKKEILFSAQRVADKLSHMGDRRKL